MKEILNLIPMFGTIVGVLLGIFVLFSRNAHADNSKARYLLALVILMTTYNLLEVFLIRHNYHLWHSYFYYHLTGFVYLLYVRSLLGLGFKIKSWITILSIYSIVHTIIVYSLRDVLLEVQRPVSEIKSEYLVLLIDYYIAIVFNVFAVIAVQRKVKTISLESISSLDHLNLAWSKKIIYSASYIYISILSLVVVYTILEVFINPNLFGVKLEASVGLLNSYLHNLMWSDKIEALLTSFFIFTIAIWSIRIPVFSSYKPLLEKENIEQKKYAKSTLKDDQSEAIWTQLVQLMEEAKLYQNPTLRLNDLAQKVDKSLPHVSQVINEKLDMNFLDFVNQYRVQEAKVLLCAEESRSMTILAIAYEVGFNSKTTFYTSFKKVVGQTPSEYKKSKK